MISANRPHALENVNVGAVRTHVLVIQELARVLLAQRNCLIQRVVCKGGKRHRIRGLVFRVQRVGLEHVLTAVHVPIL